MTLVVTPQKKKKKKTIDTVAQSQASLRSDDTIRLTELENLSGSADSGKGIEGQRDGRKEGSQQGRREGRKASGMFHRTAPEEIGRRWLRW